MPDFARTVTGAAGYRVPADDPSLRGAHTAEMASLQARLDRSAGGGAGGGFKLDVEQMRALLPQWQDLRDTLDSLRQSRRDLRQVTAPAGDECSMAQNKAAQVHADLYGRSIDDQWNYADGYVKSLAAMLKKYEHHEASAAGIFNVMGMDL